MTILSRQSDWKALAPFPHPGPTFAAQSTLQKLPVPDLQQTLTHLKQSLKPIAWSDTEYEAAVSKIDKFANGLGPRLQDRLLQRQAQTDHWLEEWWDRDMYLAYRGSVVVNVSYYCTFILNNANTGALMSVVDGFEEHPSFLPQSAVSRAAALIRAALLIRRRLKRGQLQPEATKEGPLCMDSWRYIFVYPRRHR
jgi:carnitine O-acetyltransferase